MPLWNWEVVGWGPTRQGAGNEGVSWAPGRGGVGSTQGSTAAVQFTEGREERRVRSQGVPQEVWLHQGEDGAGPAVGCGEPFISTCTE